MSRQISILPTKELKVEERQALSDAGISLVEADFISIRNIEFSLSDVKDNLIFTSQNAVRAVHSHLEVQEIRRNPVFCVGEKTADLLDESGFTVLAAADYASELAKIIVSDYALERFTFFCGNIRRDELPSELHMANVDFNEIEVYETMLSPTKIVSDVDGILFFSPSGIDSFLLENELSAEKCFCIGKTTADHLKKLKGDSVEILIADEPTVERTIAKALSYFNNSRSL